MAEADPLCFFISRLAEGDHDHLRPVTREAEEAGGTTAVAATAYAARMLLQRRTVIFILSMVSVSFILYDSFYRFRSQTALNKNVRVVWHVRERDRPIKINKQDSRRPDIA